MENQAHSTVEEYFLSMDATTLKEYFATPQDETEKLEFKSGEVSFEQLCKEVSAFANTDGGVLIFGAPREKKVEGRGEKAAYGDLEPLKEKRTSDYIYQKLMSGIIPAPLGIKITPIDLAEAGNVYIIYTPKSIKPPHQVNGTYHIRLGTMCRHAPHSIVEALFNQKKPVDLDCSGVLMKGRSNSSNPYDTFTVRVTNRSDYPAYDLQGLAVLSGKVLQNPQEKEPFDRHNLRDGNMKLTATFNFSSAVVSNLWAWRHFSGIQIYGEYFYAEIYVWSRESPCIKRIYKIKQSGEIHECISEEDKATAKEQINSWNY